MSGATRWLRDRAVLVVLVGAVPLLWYSSPPCRSRRRDLSSAVIAVLWLTGAVMQGRVRIRSALAIEAAAIALLAVSLRPRRLRVAMPAIVDDPAVQQARRVGAHASSCPARTSTGCR